MMNLYLLEKEKSHRNWRSVVREVLHLFFMAAMFLGGCSFLAVMDGSELCPIGCGRWFAILGMVLLEMLAAFCGAIATEDPNRVEDEEDD